MLVEITSYSSFKKTKKTNRQTNKQTNKINTRFPLHRNHWRRRISASSTPHTSPQRFTASMTTSSMPASMNARMTTPVFRMPMFSFCFWSGSLSKHRKKSSQACHVCLFVCLFGYTQATHNYFFNIHKLFILKRHFEPKYHKNDWIIYLDTSSGIWRNSVFVLAQPRLIHNAYFRLIHRNFTATTFPSPKNQSHRSSK